MARQLIPGKFWSEPVPLPSDLPTIGVRLFEVRMVQDAGSGLAAAYYWNGTVWIKFAEPGGAVGRLKTNVELLGATDGVNTVFTTPDYFLHDGTSNEMLYLRGVRLKEGVGNDYLVSESGGVGAGYDTITFDRAPRSGDTILIDYYIAL